MGDRGREADQPKIWAENFETKTGRWRQMIGGLGEIKHVEAEKE